MDTTGESGSAALVENGRIVEEISLESADGFAHILFGEIERLLARHGCGVRDIDLFATAAGPGSFTGVRVGIAAAKGLAEAAGRPAAAVSNLQALAWFGSRPLRAVAIDARRGEIYGAVYNQALEPVCAEVVMKLEAWLATSSRQALDGVIPHCQVWRNQAVRETIAPFVASHLLSRQSSA